MREIKSAVIGCGLISKNHLKALRNVEGARCGAVCDIVREKAAAAAGAYSENGEIQIYEDYHELLRDGDIEVVHICTPHHLHADMAVEALLRGKHVLCEKPMALTADDAKRMIKARDESGKCLGICFQNRYNESSRYMRELLESGELGKVLGGRGQVTWDRKPEYYTTSPWRGRWATEGGGVLINQAIHTFDLLQWLTGPVKCVEAGIGTRRLKEAIEVEDTVDILMTGMEGQRILFYASNCYVKNAPVELEIICEKGSVKMVGNLVVTERDGKTVSKDYSSGQVLGKDYWGSGHGFLIDDFYRCIREGRDFPVSGEEAVVSVRLLEAVYRSAKEGTAVSLLQESCPGL
ncbi:MAG: Gfo/Idh/MocA family oxidoreductase [Hungatella sp.]|nr:Gfo/Idh/MocA family oxidoreductase [Hungatella sp.]